MLLAIDTSTRTVGIALYDGTQVLGEVVWNSRDYHTVELAPAVFEILRRGQVDPGDLKVLAVATGPGSFTGLRIGLAFAKGLCLARHLPLIGIPTLDSVAAAQPVQALPLAAVLQAGRGRLALVWYRNAGDGWQAEGPPRVTTAGELAAKIRGRTIVCGELEAAERQRLARRFRNVHLASPAQCVRRPGLLAEIAWRRWQAGQVDAPQSLAPVYLHVAGGLPA